MPTLLDLGRWLPADTVTGAWLTLSAFDGKWAFVGALVSVLIWLIVMPRRLVGHVAQSPPWWRNVRVWAMVICLIQIVIYWRFG